MKGKHFFLWAMAFIVACFGFTACSDDGEALPGGGKPDAASEDTIGIVFSYDKFLTPEDVEIMSADTTVISVSRDFVESQEIAVEAGKAVCIWRTMDTEPFIRIITGVTDNGSKLILTTEPGDMGDMWNNLDIKMDTELYVDNAAQAPRRRSRATNAVEGVNYNRYMDADSVLHPAVIIVEDTTTSRSSGQNIVYTAEELMADNASFKFLNIHLNNFNVNIPLGDNSKFFIKNFFFNAESSLNISAKVRWFKLKNFECSVSGFVETGLTAGVQVKSSNKLKKDIEIAKFPSYTAVFWAGPIPVAVRMNSGIKWANVAEFSAQGTISAQASVRADYKEGVRYSGGWSSINSSSVTSSAGLDKIETALKGTLTSGIFLYSNVMLYGCAGPELSMGPSIKANVTAEATVKDDKTTLSLSTDGSINLGGEIGAKIKIWKWTIGSWSKKFSFWKKELWDYEISYEI
ncbi:MAG: hypothetical protein SOY63_03470 [Alloprevotella sp.]|nr:hypothetical protein [Alloprevotella sp.]